jgi:hypothetical protein
MQLGVGTGSQRDQFKFIVIASEAKQSGADCTLTIEIASSLRSSQ